jgi:hypothetical protein
MFSSKTIREEVAQQSQTKLKPGIHDNVYFEKFDSGETESGSSYVDIYFTRPESNESIYKRLWYPKPDAPYKRDGESDDQARSREAKEFLSHIVMLTDAILSGNDKEINAKTLEQFVQIAEQRLAKVRKDQPLYLKVIYDSDGIYSELPRFANYVQAQIEGVKRKLSYTRWEKENRMTPSTVTPPTGDDVVDNPEGDDLPF